MQITDRGMSAHSTDTDQWLVESKGRGDGAFIGRITPKGQRTFYFRYTDSAGKQVRLKIGDQSTHGYSVKSARAKALEWSAIYKGDKAANRLPVRDLREHFAQVQADRLAAELAEQAQAEKERMEKKQADEHSALARQRRLTISQLFDRWAATELTPRIQTDGKRSGRKDGGEYSRKQFDRHVFPQIGSMAAVDVRKADLMTILDAQKVAGKMRTANVLLTELKQMFRFAVTRDIVDRNPLDTVEKRHIGGKETERERVLTESEIKALATQIPIANLAWRNQLAPWLILSTACRISELMNAHWDHFDLDNRTWRIPPEHSKNQREHVVHLSDFALARFQTLRAQVATDESSQLLPWVFPSRNGKSSVCIKSFGKQLSDRQRQADKRMKNRTEATESLMLSGGRWTAHDLRRTSATLMAGLGFSNDVIDECLNHMIQSRVTRIYNRDRRTGEQARAFDALGAKLHEIVNSESFASNVVELRAA